MWALNKFNQSYGSTKQFEVRIIAFIALCYCVFKIDFVYPKLFRISKNLNKKCLNYAGLLEQTISQNVLQSIKNLFHLTLVDEVAEG